jgi:pSer/pThr/pTyr-binding forkhead associated (FHA) protein
MEKIENPARFVVHADNGEVLQEYILEKPEVSIGRAPNSDILLSKDKLTSRRHATVHYENDHYVLRDEHSANGTFVNGQQLEEMVPHVLEDGDHVGIGEHELVFYTAMPSSDVDIESMPTITVNTTEQTFRTAPDEQMTVIGGSDEFSTKSMDGDRMMTAPEAPVMPSVPSTPSAAPTPPPSPAPAPAPEPAPVANASTTQSTPAPSVPEVPVKPAVTDGNVTFQHLMSLPQMSPPDVAPLLAALAALDGQVSSLQEQLNSMQEAMHNRDTDIAQTANQLRLGVRQVSDRMDKTIADVARSREQLAWADLIQIMEDVMNNPRDIEYVTKLARKARELNKVFQIHQSVLNTLAECTSLLRGLVGEDSK